MPKAARIAVIVNPANPTSAETTLREVQAAARTLGLQTTVLHASTSREINAAFAALAGERCDALFVGGDGFLISRGVQFANLAARDRIPASYAQRDNVAVGGLMSYGADVAESARPVGVYAGRILKGEKPGDLPVVQSTKIEFVINLQTAELLGIDVPPTLLAIANEVVE